VANQERDPSSNDARRRRSVGIHGLVVLVVAVLAVDLALGAGLTWTGMWPADRGDVYLLEHEQPGGPRPLAWRDEPWAEDLMASLIDYQTDEYHFEPYVQQVGYEFHSRYLNTTDEERVSAQVPPPPGARPVRVAFFEGSVVFGIGQRDAHTIPSAFARIAAEAGVPVEVHNFGFPRLVAWQELLLFERKLAEQDDFDLVIFLDGFNELYVQSEATSRDPTHHAAAAVSDLIADFRRERATTPGTFDGLRELRDAYHRASGTWRVVDRLRGRRAELPGDDATRGTPAEQLDDALGIYTRAVARIEALARRHDVPVRLFWQPQQAGWPPEVHDRLPAGVTDLSHVFDGREAELYFDPVHTNEEGARLLAGAIWEQVGARVAAAAAR